MDALKKLIASRKLVGASLSAGALLAAWVLTQWLPMAAQYFGTLATSIVALYTAYAGGNVATKMVSKPPTDPKAGQ